MEIAAVGQTRRPRFRRAEPPAFRLTDDDVEIIRHIAQHRFLRSTHIAALVGRSLDRTNDRLERLFHADRTAEFLSPEGAAVVTYSRSGDQQIEWAGGKDSGTFQIRQDHFCSRWKTLRNGAESCTRVYKVSETEYELVGDDGVYAATMILK